MNVLVENSSLQDIADSIRAKLGVQTTYKPGEMADAIDSISGGGIVPTGTKTITENGTGIDVAQYAYADVNVPNSYAASDEGKVVSDGALVAQSSDTVTANDTYDTTLINSLTVNVSGGGGAVSGTFTPDSDLRSVTLSDCIGKSSILTFPMFDLATADITTRVHWGSLIVDGRCIMDGSTNTGKTGFIAQMTLTSGTSQLSSRDSFDSSTGTVSILSGADSNYGGYFVSGKQYGYVAW